MARTEVIWENEKLVGESLTTDEEKILEHQIKNFLASPGSFMAWLLNNNFDRIKGTLQVAKAKLEAPFVGMSAGDNEIGLQLIRAPYIVRTTATTEAGTNDWTFTFTDNGDYWLGYSTNNTTALNIDKRLCLLWLGVAWTQGSAPIVEELLIQVGSTIYPVQNIRQGWLGDNQWNLRAVPIRPIILPPKSTLLVQSWSLGGGVQEMVVLGIAFGLGDLLRAQNPTAIQT